jgi:WD40 repeat protein
LVQRSIGGHTDVISTLTFSPDGEKLVSGSFDDQIRIWNTADLLGQSQASVGFLGVGDHIQDGWITDNSGNALFWVPNNNRSRLSWPGSVVTIGGSGIPTELDLDRFRYGENWAECFEGRK